MAGAAGTVAAMTRTRLLTGAIALGLTAAACAGPANDDAGDTLAVASPSPTAPAAEPVADSAVPDRTAGDVVVPAALQFSAPLVGGGEIDLAELGDRPVLLWFWAPW